MGNIILWVNEFFGRVDFLEKAISKELPGRVVGSVAVQRRNPDTFGRDIEDMLVRKQTFDEAIESSETLIMAKERLKIVRRDLFEQLDNVPLCPRLTSFLKDRAS